MRAVVLGAVLFGALVARCEAPACAYAREEFARLWRGVSDCPAPMLRLEADASAARSPVLESLRSQVRDDGYALLARTNVLTIVARRPRGCLYGVYGYFQRFAGVRWYFPGKDGEMLLHRPDFSLGEFSVVENPSFAGRSFNLVSAYCMPETILWMVRNRLQPALGQVRHTMLHLPQTERYDPARYDLTDEVGGHFLSELLDDSLFGDHPGCFAEIDGRRVKQKDEKGRWRSQPCSTSADGLARMAESVSRLVSERPFVGRLVILNNDCGGWCQCLRCRQKFGESDADRYWAIANRLIEASRRVKPDLEVNAHAYQTFQVPPKTLRADTRAGVTLCVHGRCYVHSVGDENCPFNERYRRLVRQWKALRPSFFGTYEYTNCLPGNGFFPVARVLYDDIRWYRDAGCTRYKDEVIPLDGRVAGRPVETDPYRGLAFAHYVQARTLWDADVRFEDLEEEFMSFLYGAAASAMKRFHALLRKGCARSQLYLCYGAKGDELWRAVPNERVVQDLCASLEKARTELPTDAPRRARVEWTARRFRDVFLSTLANRAKPHREIVNGRPSYLLNGDFEFGLTGWGQIGAGKLVTGAAASGTNFVTATSRELTLYQAPAFVLQDNESIPRFKVIKVRAFFRGKGEASASLRFEDVSCPPAKVSASVASGDWEPYELSLDASAFASPPKTLFLTISPGVEMDGVRLECRR